MTSSKPKPDLPHADSERAAAYARFIPREEVHGFAAWSPGDFGATPDRRKNTAEAAKPEAAAQIAAQVQAARQSGYQDGYRDGLAALEGFKQSFASQTTAQIGLVLQSLDHGLRDLQQDLARTLAVSATQLARQIVRTELSAQPTNIALVAEEALNTLLLSAQHITLRVHPDDQALVAQGAAEVLAARGARVLADVSISRGGCLVESDIGVIDANIETRWRRAVASLGCDMPWEPEPEMPEPDA